MRSAAGSPDRLTSSHRDQVVYLDHAATTPMCAEAVAAMLPFLTDRYGNPSGTHAVARAAQRALDDAREQLAILLGAHPGDVVFTSGGTEADNLAVSGVAGSSGVAVALRSPPAARSCAAPWSTPPCWSRAWRRAGGPSRSTVAASSTSTRSPTRWTRPCVSSR